MVVVLVTLQGRDLAIQSEDAFFEYRRIHGIKGGNFSEIIDAIQGLVLKYSRDNFRREPTTGSLNNCRGRWFEMTTFSAFYEATHEIGKGAFVFKAPSARFGTSDYLSLFNASDVKDLRKKNLFCSNPDFVVGTCTKIEQRLDFKDAWSRGWSELRPRLALGDVKVLLSIKTSTRPDRRYQMVHEANTIKTIHQLAGTPSEGVRYYAILLESGLTDEDIFSYPVTYKLALGTVERAIDGIIPVETYDQAKKFINGLLANERKDG